MYKKTHLIVTVAALSALQLFAACGEQAQEETIGERVIAVNAVVVERSDQTVTRIYTGTLEGKQQTVVYSRLAEAVDEVLVAEGQQVKADQVVLTLDRYGASSQYTQAQSVFLNAEKNFNKMAFLYKEGAVSETEHDAARTEYEVNKAAFEAVAKMVEVPSPIAGVVTSMEVSPGDLVYVGQELATVATTDRLRVKFGVNSDEIESFTAGSEVNVLSDAVDGKLAGQVVAIAGSADPVTRSFEVEALFDNSSGLFRPGMFVRVEFVRERLESVVSIPRKAVLTLDGKETIFVVKEGRADKREVTLGADLSGEVVVTSGLSAGDTLVVLGQDYLDDGINVNVTSLDE
ncbi:MAG: efflux RND transporter periplasmic adaptor subunit [bacterium]|nr:efflux RND transporter periplasmic adaptor subunit [bacterium]